MGMYLNPGNEGFQISVNDDIYVDKSGLIAHINDRIGKRKRYICVSRPRRFGKSMAAEMLSAYYDKSCHSDALFQKLEIAGNSSYKKHLNQYDVIFVNVQQFLRMAGTLQDVAGCIERKVLAEIKEIYGEWIAEDESSLPNALATVYSKSTSERKGFVFIIDEWDCIFREAQEDKEAQKIYLDFLRDLFKDRTYVKVAYMTGILPIKKYGTHSALNIFDEFSMLRPGMLAQYVGFTEQEVEYLCETYQMDYQKAKEWYDGYCLESVSHVYNPKSIIDAMLEKKYKSYWVSTETYEALQVYIDLNQDGLKDAIIVMLGGGRCGIDTGTFQNDMVTFKNRDDVLTLLVHLGYLAYDEESNSVFIPNEEVKGEFIRAIRTGKRQELVKAIQDSEQLLDATLSKNETEVARLIDEVHAATTSSLTYNNELSLSAVIQLAYYSARDDYYMIRELPAGKGFADMVFLPRVGVDKPALLIELKWDQCAKGAITQIKEKNYVQAIEHYGGDILLVGISYNKKTKEHECLIEEYRK